MMISVIVPAYNEESIISKCIKSVISQSYSDFELIIVNDGSTDKTKDLILDFSRKDSRIRLINHDTPQGQANARNHGARVAKGGILFFLDADEWLIKGALKNTFDLFKKYDPDAIATTRRVVFPKDFSRIWVYKFRNNWAIMKGTFFAKKSSLDCPYVMKKNVFKKLGGFPKGTYYFEDYILVKKIHDLGLNVLITDKIVVESDMGSSFNDFFKRARNIGKGLVISKMFFKSIKLLLTVSFFVSSFFIPYLFFIFYCFFSILWFKRTNDLLTSLLAPLLFPLEKFISGFFFFREVFKKLFY